MEGTLSIYSFLVQSTRQPQHTTPFTLSSHFSFRLIRGIPTSATRNRNWKVRRTDRTFVVSTVGVSHQHLVRRNSQSLTLSSSTERGQTRHDDPIAGRHVSLCTLLVGSIVRACG